MDLLHIFCYEVFFVLSGDCATLSLGLGSLLVLGRIVGCATGSQSCMIVWCLSVAARSRGDGTVKYVSKFSAFFVNCLKNQVFNYIIVVALFWFFKLRLGQLGHNFALFLYEMLVIAVDLTLYLLFIIIDFGDFSYGSLVLLGFAMMVVMLWLLRDILSQVEAHITSDIMHIFDDLWVVDGSRVAGRVTLRSVVCLGVIEGVLGSLLRMLTLFRWCSHYVSRFLSSTATLNYFLRVNDLRTSFAVSYRVKIR